MVFAADHVAPSTSNLTFAELCLQVPWDGDAQVKP